MNGIIFETLSLNFEQVFIIASSWQQQFKFNNKNMNILQMSLLLLWTDFCTLVCIASSRFIPLFYWFSFYCQLYNFILTKNEIRIKVYVTFQNVFQIGYMNWDVLRCIEMLKVGMRCTLWELVTLFKVSNKDIVRVWPNFLKFFSKTNFYKRVQPV